MRLEILTLGRDLATVNLEFKVRGRDLIGRQSQTWVRFPDLGLEGRLRARLHDERRAAVVSGSLAGLQACVGEPAPEPRRSASTPA